VVGKRCAAAGNNISVRRMEPAPRRPLALVFSGAAIKAIN
jgi:hypothetical protein